MTSDLEGQQLFEPLQPLEDSYALSSSMQSNSDPIAQPNAFEYPVIMSCLSFELASQNPEQHFDDVSTCGVFESPSNEVVSDSHATSSLLLATDSTSNTLGLCCANPGEAKFKFHSN